MDLYDVSIVKSFPVAYAVPKEKKKSETKEKSYVYFDPSYLERQLGQRRFRASGYYDADESSSDSDSDSDFIYVVPSDTSSESSDSDEDEPKRRRRPHYAYWPKAPSPPPRPKVPSGFIPMANHYAPHDYHYNSHNNTYHIRHATPPPAADKKSKKSKKEASSDGPAIHIKHYDPHYTHKEYHNCNNKHSNNRNTPPPAIDPPAGYPIHWTASDWENFAYWYPHLIPVVEKKEEKKEEKKPKDEKYDVHITTGSGKDKKVEKMYWTCRKSDKLKDRGKWYDFFYGQGEDVFLVKAGGKEGKTLHKAMPSAAESSGLQYIMTAEPEKAMPWISRTGQLYVQSEGKYLPVRAAKLKKEEK